MLCVFLLFTGLAQLAFGQPWDQRNQTYNLEEARTMAIMSQEAYYFRGTPDLSGTPGWTLVNVYSGGLDVAFIARTSGVCCVAFRGSTSISDWISNLNFFWSDFRQDFGNGNLMTYSHTGFRNGWENVRGQRSPTDFLNSIKSCLGSSNRLLVTGHSRGGALASHMGIQFAMDSSLDSGGYNFSRFRSTSSSSLVVYTFGEPREVSRGYQNNPWTAVHNIRKFRFIYEEDVACSVPPNLGVTPFEHWGAAFHMKSGGIKQVEHDFPYVLQETGSVLDHVPENYVRSLGG